MHVGVSDLGESRAGLCDWLCFGVGWLGYPRLYCSTSVAFGVTDWLVLVCSWAQDSYCLPGSTWVISCSDVCLMGAFGLVWYAYGWSYHSEGIFQQLFLDKSTSKDCLKFSMLMIGF